MKKIFAIIIVLVGLFYLYNLGLKHGEIRQARQELNHINDKTKNGENIVDTNEKNKENNDGKEKKNKKEENLENNNLYDLDKITYEKKLIGSGDDKLFMGMPEGPLFGKVLNLDGGKITYSNISELVIEKKDFDIEKLKTSNDIWNTSGTGYLNNIDTSYVYWNTLRPIDFNNIDSGNSFYVLVKNDDKLEYYKYYFDFNHKLFGKLKIKEFEVDKEQKIGDQMLKLNSELKNQNKDFELVKKTDFLFKEIVR